MRFSANCDTQTSASTTGDRAPAAIGREPAHEVIIPEQPVEPVLSPVRMGFRYAQHGALRLRSGW